MAFIKRSMCSGAFSAMAKIVTVTLLMVGLSEALAAFVLSKVRAARPVYMLSYTDDEIRRLYDTDQPNLYREVLAESWRFGDTEYSPLVEFRMVPFEGRHLNISAQGFRLNGRGPGSLSESGSTVFVFGGSTALGSGVRDSETIPAYLEGWLRDAGIADAQVYNFGVVSWYSTQERILLERLLTAGTKPDVAVFVDGLNDFYYCTIPDQTAWNERLTATTHARSRMPLGVELAHRSSVVQLARWLGGDQSVAVREWGSFCAGDDDALMVARRLDTNRRMIAAIAAKLGFKVVFVQQPVPTYSYDNSKRLYPLKPEMLGYHVNSAKGYSAMARLRVEGNLATDDLLWLAELEPAGNAYIDTVHYSPGFNKAIGAAIGRHILDRGLLARKTSD